MVDPGALQTPWQIPLSPPSTEKSFMSTQILYSVKEILLPFTGELPAQPSVRLDDHITTAIEVMVRHNLRIIPVTWNMRPVGQVRLKDALAIVGIRTP